MTNGITQRPYEAPESQPESLQDDELLAEIVNIWTHGERGSNRSGEGLFSFLIDNGHIDQIENVIREYKKRKGLPLGPWTCIKDFRPEGHAYYQDSTGRISVADCSGGTPDTCNDGPLYLDLRRDLKSERLVVPLRAPGDEAGDHHTVVINQPELEWLQLLWEGERNRLGIKYLPKTAKKENCE